MIRKKVRICFLLTALILIVMTLTVQAEETEEGENIIKVGYPEAIATFIGEVDSVSNKGYGYEIFEKIEEISDLEFEYVPIKGEVTEAINDGTVDIAGFFTKTPDREEVVAYSEIWYGKTYVALMTDDENILYGDYSEINGKTVATYEGNIAQEALDDFCIENNIKVEYVYGSMENYMDLDSDFYITYSQHEDSAGKNNVLSLGVYNLFLMSSFENQEILNQIDNALIEVVATEGNFFLELEEKYIANDIELNHRSLTVEEINKLKERPLEVGYVADYQPISFTNDRGEADGAMIEVLNIFSKEYGFEINYHPYSIYDDYTEYKDYDILVTLYGDSAEINSNYENTESYYDIPMFAQMPVAEYEETDTARELIEKSPTIGSLKYLGVDFPLFLKAFPENEIVFYEDWHKLLDDFDSGKINTIISTESAVTYTELYLGELNSISVNTDLELPMQFYISNDIAEEYVPIFNVMLDTLTEVEYRSILNNKANEYFPERNLIDLIKENWYNFALGGVVIVLGFFTYAYFQQRRRKGQILEAYNTDQLTGLMGFNRFNEEVENRLEKARTNEFELISFDMDMFKTINEYFGKEKGTEVIIATAEVLKGNFANSPKESYLLTRRTGEEFLIFRKIDEGGSVEEICDKVLLRVRDVIGEKYRKTMSFGKVAINDSEEKITTYISQADNARLIGKNRNENTFVEFDSVMKKEYENKVELTFRMEEALKNREFAVVYQPKVSFETLKIEGAEALVRWISKGGKAIYPDEFIPVFEKNGFISYLDMYVLEEACKFINEKRNEIKVPRISVNLSAYSIFTEDIEVKIEEALRKHKVAIKEIELEITETGIVENEIEFIEKVNKLKSKGFIISIDDFGAGVSSLNRISLIEADILKLDKAFFDNDEKDKGKGNTVVADVITMAKHLGMQTVAEGVEIAKQAAWLKSIGCDYAQGYYFERPLDRETFVSRLKEDKEYGIS